MRPGHSCKVWLLSRHWWWVMRLGVWLLSRHWWRVMRLGVWLMKRNVLCVMEKESVMSSPVRLRTSSAALRVVSRRATHQ